MASIVAKKNKKGKTYYIVYSFQEINSTGKRKNKLKWLKAGDTKQDAEEALRIFHKEYKAKRARFNSFEPIKFKVYIEEELLPWCKVRKLPKCYSATMRSLTLFSNFAGNIYINDINTKLIERFVTWRKAPNNRGNQVSNRTVNVDLIYISQSLNKAKEWGFISTNNIIKVPKLKESKGKVRFFSKNEIESLLNFSNPYIERFLIVGISTGMRYSEILNLRLDNIDLKNNVIHITNNQEFRTKNRKDRDIPINPILRERLPIYLNTWINPYDMSEKYRNKNQSVYLFCKKDGSKVKSVRRSFTRLMEKAGINDATIHTMRHTFASYLVMGGANIRAVQELLGHSSISVTEIYSHLTNSHKQEVIKLLTFQKGCEQYEKQALLN